MRAVHRSLLALALTLPAPILAQSGVTVQSSTDMRFFGGLGTLVNFASRFGGGGNMHDMATTMYLAGHKMRHDDGKTGMIIDLDAGRVTSLDHNKKTYTSMTFAEMAEMMRQVQENAKQEMAKEKSKAAAKDPTAPKGELHVKPKVTFDHAGQHESIAGYDAERVFLTIELAAEAQPEGETSQQVGTMVFLIDQWVAKDAPQGAALREFQKAYRAKVGEEFKSQVQGLQAAFASDPRIKDGFETAAKELANQKGIPLRTNTFVAVVPAGMTFDRQLVLGDASTPAPEEKKEEKKGGGLRGFMGKVKQAAEQANKNGDEKTQGPPKQSTLMQLKDEVKTITPGAPPADVFAPPAGYKEVKPQMPRSQ